MLFRQGKQGIQVFLVAVNPTVGHKAHKVEGTAILLNIFDGAQERRVLEKRTPFYIIGNPHKILVQSCLLLY